MNIKGKKIIVTGATGFIGKHVTRRLEELGAHVIYISSSTDIRDMNQVKTIPKSDIVIHLAANASVDNSWDDPVAIYDINTLGTLNMLEFCRNGGAEKLIFSSTYVYGNKEGAAKESDPPDPTNPYTVSKVMAEDICRSYNINFGIDVVILRLFNVFGNGQKKSYLIPSILMQLGSGKVKLNDPNPKRDFIHVKDVANAFSLAAVYDKQFGIFNIGTGKSRSIKDVVDIILRISGKKSEIIYSGRRKNEIMDSKADITKAREELGWEPKISFEDGIRKLLETSS